MENAVDAFVMAGSVLLLIIALSVSISSFTSLKSQVDEILSIEEETDLAIDSNGNYLNYVQGASMTRTVTAETVISAIRRISKENYDIYIIGDCINTTKVGNTFEDTFNALTTDFYYSYGDLYYTRTSEETIDADDLYMSKVYTNGGVEAYFNAR